MKNAAVLALALVVCFCNPGWGKMEYQPQCGPTLFEVLLDIVTAPCSLLATCVGLDERSICSPPRTIKKVVLVRECVETSTPVVRTQKPKYKAPAEKIEGETPQQVTAAPAPPAQQQVPVAPVPLDQSTVSEKPLAQPIPKVEAPRAEVVREKLPPEQPQPVTATMPAPAPLPTDRASTERREKPVIEIVQPKAGTVADAPENLPKPQISPPKVEQKSTQEASEEPKKEQSESKMKKSTGYRGCSPSVPYYQTYPSCGPRFFFR